MSTPQQPERGRVIGIGGVFFKASDKARMLSWYTGNLGFHSGPEGITFRWRSHDQPDAEHLTVWSLFPADSKYFDPSHAPFMINYIVDDLDALLEKLRANSVTIDPKREDYDFGRFAWVYDPEGNKIELWEPK